MAAGEETETLIAELPLADGYVLGLYTIVTDEVDDYVILSNMETVRWANAFTTADGTRQKAYHDATTTNKVTLNVAGTATLIAIGTSIKSTGGAT